MCVPLAEIFSPGQYIPLAIMSSGARQQTRATPSPSSLPRTPFPLRFWAKEFESQFYHVKHQWRLTSARKRADYTANPRKNTDLSKIGESTGW